MMGALAEGAFEEKGYILGIIPEFFKEAGAEVSFKNCTEYIYTDTMRERKRELEENSNGFIITPGGIGTLDEFFEILTLKQLGRHNKPIAIYNINGFFDDKAAQSEEVAGWSESGIKKLKSCYMKNLADAGLIESTKTRVIRHALVNYRIEELLHSNGMDAYINAVKGV